MLGSLVPTRDLLNAVSLLQANLNGARLLGPLLAAPLLHVGGGVGAFRGGFASLHNGIGDRREGFHEHHDRDRRFFFGGVWPYGWDYYPDYGYYDYTQPYSSQTWYYCSDPSGYYPYVTQCNTGWQAVPAS